VKKLIYILFFIFFTYHSGFSQKNEILFNGENLNGWDIYGTELWYVDNGELVSESGPNKEYGYLLTEKNYNNFLLHLEFKQESNGNSGVFFRSKIDGVKISGWQVEVAPTNQFTGGIYESYGRGWLIKPDITVPDNLNEGDWNILEIKVLNSEVTTWLNGKKVVYLNDNKIKNGVGGIALQIHDGGGIKVRWKNIYLQKL